MCTWCGCQYFKMYIISPTFQKTCCTKNAIRNSLSSKYSSTSTVYMDIHNDHLVISKFQKFGIQIIRIALDYFNFTSVVVFRVNVQIIIWFTSHYRVLLVTAMTLVDLLMINDILSLSRLFIVLFGQQLAYLNMGCNKLLWFGVNGRNHNESKSIGCTYYFEPFCRDIALAFQADT